MSGSRVLIALIRYIQGIFSGIRTKIISPYTVIRTCLHNYFHLVLMLWRCELYEVLLTFKPCLVPQEKTLFAKFSNYFPSHDYKSNAFLTIIFWVYAAYSALCVPALRIELMGTQSHLFARKKARKKWSWCFLGLLVPVQWRWWKVRRHQMGWYTFIFTNEINRASTANVPSRQSRPNLDRADQISTRQTKSRQSRPNLDKKSKDHMLSN